MKDYIISFVVALICAFFCGAILIGFEQCAYLPIATLTIVGGVLGTWWKESLRRSEKPDTYTWISYGAGTLVAMIANYFLANAQAASIA